MRRPRERSAHFFVRTPGNSAAVRLSPALFARRINYLYRARLQERELQQLAEIYFTLILLVKPIFILVIICLFQAMRRHFFAVRRPSQRLWIV